jgi:hypothetical protein
MKKFYAVVVFAFSICLFSHTSNASHIVGGQIEYECVSGDSLLVHLYLYGDCSGMGMPNTINVSSSSTCGTVGYISLSMVLDSLGNHSVDAGSICGPDSLNTTCYGGTLPGVQLYHYQGYNVLTSACDTWTLSWSTCCRNTSTNVPTSSANNIYLETTVNTVTAPCDNSPTLMHSRVEYLCNNQAQTVNFAAFDVDGDSLVYALDTAMEGAGLPLVYASGYSSTGPLTGIVLDPVTGIATVTPNATGNFIVAVLIESYDSNGNLIGTILVDREVVVLNCANNISSLSSGATNLTGAAILLDSMTIEACGGISFCFDFQVSDLDPNDTITLVNNVQSHWPGAVVTLSGSNPLNINVCWTAPGGNGGNYYLPLLVTDNACPISGNNTHVILLSALAGTAASPDVLSCGGAPVQLNAMGGSSFTWTVISGDPIVVGVNFNCDTCANPLASPAVATTYLVTSNFSGGCFNTDTVTVTVDPGFTTTLTDTGFGSGPCAHDSLELTVSPSAGGTYTYSWSPASNVSDPSISNPILVVAPYGTYNLTVTTTATTGCVQTDSFYYSATNPSLVASSGDTFVCAGDSIELFAGSTSTGGAACITSLAPCSNTPNVGTIGAGSTGNTSTTWPAPYGNFFRNAKHQFLFTAAELNAMGLFAGNIIEVSWEVTAIHGTTDYNDYTVRMGCTGSSDLGLFETALSTVMAPQDITIVLGWNTHIFDAAYLWDGVSNIVLEICYDNLALGFTNNSITPQDQTAHVSSLVYYSDASPACPVSSPMFQLSARPVTRFGWCASTINDNEYAVQWTPSVGVGTPTSSTTLASPMQDTWYVVTATDTVNGCVYPDSVFVSVGALLAVTASVSDNEICDGDTITLVANAGTGISHSWSPSAELFNPTSGTTEGTPSTATTFTVVATDSIGCAGTASVFVDVYLSPNTGPIVGLLATIDSTSEDYSVTGGSGSTFVWTVAGGTIVSGQGTNSVVISWGANGVGSISVVETNQAGCVGTPSILDVSVGIDDSFAPAMFNFDVHPNPAKAQATLTVIGLTNYQFEILDVTGKLIRKVENIGEPQFAFDVHDLTKGVYFIRVTSGDTQHSETKRLVIL